ncbi:hypothetical protein NPIL_304561 [Nephila pilipes]|uniref:Uncharacterized protein n=1 Tax=Nephila pilipes TaxID=299642 RepID=A0A8X6PD35_NEPPI|nr:hypothetical protein NPIL_304561 [Nephila pilipes]
MDILTKVTWSTTNRLKEVIKLSSPSSDAGLTSFYLGSPDILRYSPAVTAIRAISQEEAHGKKSSSSDMSDYQKDIEQKES